MRLAPLLLALFSVPATAAQQYVGATFGLGVSTDEATFDRGFGAHASVDVRRGIAAFSLRTSFAALPYDQSASDTALLAGFVHGDELGTVWIGAGPSLTRFSSYYDFASYDACLSQPNAETCAFRVVDGREVGMAFGVRFFPLAYERLRFGLYGYLNVNRVQTFQGITLSVQRGWGWD